MGITGKKSRGYLLIIYFNFFDSPDRNFIIDKIEYMPLKQLYILEKLKFLAANKSRTKKQIVSEVEKNAQMHQIINERQEAEDDKRVDHAQKELRAENQLADDLSAHKSEFLAISVSINLILLTILLMTWVLIFYY